MDSFQLRVYVIRCATMTVAAQGIVHVHHRADDVVAAIHAAGLAPERRLTALVRGEAKWQVLVCGTSRLDTTMQPMELQLSL